MSKKTKERPTNEQIKQSHKFIVVRNGQVIYGCNSVGEAWAFTQGHAKKTSAIYQLLTLK